MENKLGNLLVIILKIIFNIYFPKIFDKRLYYNLAS